MGRQTKEADRLKAKLDARGVDLFLFDLDDTLTPTREIFAVQMDTTYNYLLKQLPGTQKKDLKTQFEAINNQAFEKFAVNPNRWITVLSELSKIYPKISQAALRQSLLILMQIYKTPVNYKDGAEQMLETFKNAGVQTGIVTHANRDWTWDKYCLGDKRDSSSSFKMKLLAVFG